MEPNTPPPPDALSRRQVLGGLAAAGVAATVGAPAAANAGAAPASPPQNPVTQYPQPPFPQQQQPWPGLASRMTPRPDHGETSYKGSGRLAGRKALVTGGDSGIGRAAAIAFAREGADVAINYLPAEEPDAQEVVAVIRQAGRKAVAIPGDIRTEAFCQQLVDRAARELGGLDLLANVAGRQQQRQAIAELTSEDFDATLKTNAYALFWITKAALPHMGPGSTIINTTSEQGFNPDPWLLDYAPTKAFIANFTKALAKQVGKRGIRVNGVAPGPYWTALQVTGGTPQEKVPTFGQDTPYGRPGQPAEIAALYVHLASPESSFANGSIMGESAGKGLP
ncbi:dehydrogenase [Gemmatimonadetes bacterium T265]|nr:dehydrogenase [Gemmatimonadetes bacterium T265]